MGEHEGDEAGTSSDVEDGRDVWLRVLSCGRSLRVESRELRVGEGSPSAEEDAVRADFHGTGLVVNYELLEAEHLGKEYGERSKGGKEKGVKEKGGKE